MVERAGVQVHGLLRRHAGDFGHATEVGSALAAIENRDIEGAAVAGGGFRGGEEFLDFPREPIPRKLQRIVEHGQG